MSRAIVLILDSLGVGASLDASCYGDDGANTFYHIAQAAFEGKADKLSLRQGPLNIPNLVSLGLNEALWHASGMRALGMRTSSLVGSYGYGVEQSKGKDTPSGHWEIAGLPVHFEWGYFEKKEPCFPQELLNTLIQEAHLPGILGNKHASGTEIIAELGALHIQTGAPIVYTSADSVFQIACHETYFGLERLYALCELSRRLVDPYHIGRVIARPFVGEEGAFQRTGHRKDYVTPPHEKTLLDELLEAGGHVIAIGKIGDIFAHRGIRREMKADGNMALFDATLQAICEEKRDQTLIFTNFVDFDMLYGHRRDVVGYAKALESLDERLPELLSALEEDDLLIISADHGCDPTYLGSDHTREYVPILMYEKGRPPHFLGRRESFADIGKSVAQHLHISPLKYGVSFL